MTRTTDIVVTTIFEPAWLDGYLTNVREHDRLDEVSLRIICDRKTPATVYEAASRAQAQGFRVDCPTLAEQSDFLRRLPIPDEFIPWNTDNRRNIGFLRAWESGADVLISIDDDNYCLPDSDFVGSHLAAGQLAGDGQDDLRVADEGWFNICELLEVDSAVPIWARGFPYASRRPECAARRGALAEPLRSSRVAVNAGLWIGDPDVDAITRLAVHPSAQAATPTAVILGPKAWSPINTQNTAIVRDAIPAYYYVRMGYPLQGMKIDRFGDILSGYFLQACTKHLHHSIRIGTPVAQHRRTPHDLLQDLYHELAGVLLIEELVPWLQEIELSGGDYFEAYESLANALREQADQFRGFVWEDGGRSFLIETSQSMLDWLGVLRVLMPS